MTDTLIVYLPANASISSREEQPTPLGKFAFPDKNMLSVSTQQSDSIMRVTRSQSQSQGQSPVSRGSTQKFPLVSSVSNLSNQSLMSALDANDSTTTHTVSHNVRMRSSTTTAVTTPLGTGHDWTHVPLITGPMYLIVNTVYVICDCTLTQKWLSIVPRDTSYSAIKMKVKKLIEFKMLNFLHYFDYYLLELVLQGDVDEASFRRASTTAILAPEASVKTVRPSVPCKFSEMNRLPKKETKPLKTRRSTLSPSEARSHHTTEEETKPSKTRRSTLSASEALSPQTPLTVPEDVSPHPFRSRRSVSSKGHPGGKGYSIVTLKALDGERFFDWVEALEDVRDVSAMPLGTQPTVQPTEPHLRPEYPVFGQKFYALA